MTKRATSLWLALTLACSAMSIVPAHAAPSAPAAEKAVASAAKTPPGASKAPAETRALADSEMVSINSASAEMLAESLNGVGLKKAQAIVSYREANGPFNSVDELRSVPGIGNALVERNLPRLKL
ncbi:ComEA family DNA-binding protein [Entomohabitans teleogrylli]|uniref:ComEA family DNA-binding protein n=1 Tax=Entomohabitans teleogrylli TaxID=1384589 RepID=UPI00073D5CA0|nr:helix-hairpin-helix domain-containing protein [Entomohabitans teleogrylli]